MAYDKEKGLHLLLYDGECGLCDRAVQFVLNRDKKELFLFAPLQGQTAQRYLPLLPSEEIAADSVILICNYNTSSEHLLLRGKALFKILWLIGGSWRLIGWLSYTPSWLYDWCYRIIAHYRYLLVRTRCTLPKEQNQNRFLP